MRVFLYCVCVRVLCLISCLRMIVLCDSHNGIANLDCDIKLSNFIEVLLSIRVQSAVCLFDLIVCVSRIKCDVICDAIPIML